MAIRPSSLVQGSTAQVESLPAPVGGWNVRDSYANMAPTDAITLTNMFPTVSNVVLRGGYSEWCTGLDGEVQTLMNYGAGNSVYLYAITSTGKLYDVTTAGAVGAPKVTGLTNGIWEYTNVTSTAGVNYLYAVNGADKPILWDGTTWLRVDGASAIAITGVTTTTLINTLLFKNRLWFFQKSTLVAWYLPTNSVGGAAQKVDLSSVARFGGHIVDFDTWTIDAGYGVDDNIVFITSMGEVIVYSGTDPASAATWALIGVWKLGSPVGTRSMLKWGGDLLILTYDGLMPMAASLQSSRLDPRVALSDKIQGAITSATTTYGGNHASVGWQVFYNAKNNAVWINIPVSTGYQQQYVMNTITKSWCQFMGWGASCWETFNDDPYFGGTNKVYKAWDTNYSDNGSNIQTVALQAFNYFGQRAVKKYFTRARPSIFSNGSPSIFVGMNIDFDTSNTTAPLNYTPSTSAIWDVTKWDVGLWGSDGAIQNTWIGITGIGYCGAPQLQSASSGLQVEWSSTDVVYQAGWAGV